MYTEITERLERKIIRVKSLEEGLLEVKENM